MDHELTFGQWLKRRRRGLGLTQRTLGQQAGYASETIRKVEADELRPSVQMAERLAEALRIEAAERDRFVRFARDEPHAGDGHLSTQSVAVQGAAAPPRRHNLPAALTTFIGRRDEQAAVLSLLGSHRLVTITGSGGMGKSRLSLAAAAQLVDQFPGGVWLVPLAALTESAHVLVAVADALGVNAAAPQRLEALKDYLRHKSLLLVLDNCEHLIEASADLAQTLLHAAPGLRLLATSREALGIAGEVVYAIPSLSLPPDAPAQPPSSLMTYEAVQLFSDRAGAALPGFAVTTANAAVVAQVCRRLEGMPLAIELAAARIKVLRVDQIAARLDDRFGLLAGGPRTGLPRHQTLKATIDWSYELLPSIERTVLRRAAVFAGGWTLEAAEAVCADGEVEAGHILDALTGLARKSMIVVDRAPGQEARYRLLEMIREYASERLMAAGEQVAARLRHAACYAALAEQAEVHVYQADQARWLQQFRAELDNLRAALQWSLEGDGDRVVGIRLATALYRYWVLHGYLAEGVRWTGLAYRADGPPEAERTPEAAQRRGRLCARGAYVIMMAGDMPRALAFAEEGLALCRAFGTPDDLAFAMNLIAWTTWFSGQPEQAKGLFEAAIPQARLAQNRWYEAVALYQLGGIAVDLNRYAEAEAHWQACLVICTELQEELGVNDIRGRLALLAAVRGRLEEARALAARQLAGYQALEIQPSIAQAVTVTGELALAAGDYAQAHQALEEALKLYREQSERNLTGHLLFMLAELARREKEPDHAEQLLEESLTMAGGPEGNDRYRVALVCRSRGALARERGATEQALSMSRASLAMFREIALDKRALAQGLNELAYSLITAGQAARAVPLLAAADAYLAQLGSVLLPVHQADRDAALGVARAALSDAEFATAWSAGAALTLEQAVALGLREDIG